MRRLRALHAEFRYGRVMREVTGTGELIYSRRLQHSVLVDSPVGHIGPEETNGPSLCDIKMKHAASLDCRGLQPILGKKEETIARLAKYFHSVVYYCAFRSRCYLRH